MDSRVVKRKSHRHQFLLSTIIMVVITMLVLLYLSDFSLYNIIAQRVCVYQSPSIDIIWLQFAYVFIGRFAIASLCVWIVSVCVNLYITIYSYEKQRKAYIYSGYANTAINLSTECVFRPKRILLYVKRFP
jgi:hypothetical protein